MESSAAPMDPQRMTATSQSPALGVATWNLFHGRSVPPMRANLLHAFAAALGSRPWDVAALQEVPSWWPARLGEALNASVRSTRTSLVRGAFAGAQEAIHRRDPELLEAGGAGVNTLLIRPEAGLITAHESAVLRWLPMRRTVHGVRLRRPGGETLWVCNMHAHNAPLEAAERDLRLALDITRDWAGGEPLLLLGDLNVVAPERIANGSGFNVLGGQRVDHLLGFELELSGELSAERIYPRPDLRLSDHRLITADVAITPQPAPLVKKSR
jgi:endonuclease/exonuclease/phosphatase family metal-dependent hydrolase